MRPALRLPQRRLPLRSSSTTTTRPSSPRPDARRPPSCVFCQCQCRATSHASRPGRGDSWSRPADADAFPSNSLMDRIRRQREAECGETDDNAKKAAPPGTGSKGRRIRKATAKANSLREPPPADNEDGNRHVDEDAETRPPLVPPAPERYPPSLDPLNEIWGQHHSEEDPSDPRAPAHIDIDLSRPSSLSDLGSLRFPGGWVDDKDALSQIPGARPRASNHVQGLDTGVFAGRARAAGGTNGSTEDVEGEVAGDQEGLSPAREDQHTSPYSLIIRGVSPHVKAMDFTRLAPGDLSSWATQIKTVRQLRSRTTLEPLSAFRITFHSADAALFYRDELVRLHRLARFRAQHAPASALWKAAVPAALRSRPDADPDEDLANFAILPTPHAPLDIRRCRAASASSPGPGLGSGPSSWVRRLERTLRGRGGEQRPPTVVLDVFPPAPSSEGVMSVVRRCMDPPPDDALLHPVYLDPAMHRLDRSAAGPGYQGMDLGVPTVNKGRLLMVFTSDLEARRFHRFFNNRIIEGAPGSRQEQIWRTRMLEW